MVSAPPQVRKDGGLELHDRAEEEFGADRVPEAGGAPGEDAGDQEQSGEYFQPQLFHRVSFVWSSVVVAGRSPRA